MLLKQCGGPADPQLLAYNVKMDVLMIECGGQSDTTDVDLVMKVLLTQCGGQSDTTLLT
jgi:hypothetical protein